MTAVLFSSTLIFTLSKDFLCGVEQCAQRGTFSWNIFFCVEQFRGTIFLRGTFWANYLQPGVLLLQVDCIYPARPGYRK
jgi:hypothetical protein